MNFSIICCWGKAKIPNIYFSSVLFALPVQTSTKQEAWNIATCKHLKTFRLTITTYSPTGTGPHYSRPSIAALSSGNSWEHKFRFYLSTVILSIVNYDWSPAIYLLADGAARNIWPFIPDKGKFKNSSSLFSNFGDVSVGYISLNRS